jgi:hypothetical protein
VQKQALYVSESFEVLVTAIRVLMGVRGNISVKLPIHRAHWLPLIPVLDRLDLAPWNDIRSTEWGLLPNFAPSFLLTRLPGPWMDP